MPHPRIWDASGRVIEGRDKPGGKVMGQTQKFAAILILAQVPKWLVCVYNQQMGRQKASKYSENINMCYQSFSLTSLGMGQGSFGLGIFATFRC